MKSITLVVAIFFTSHVNAQAITIEPGSTPIRCERTTDINDVHLYDTIWVKERYGNLAGYNLPIGRCERVLQDISHHSAFCVEDKIVVIDRATGFSSDSYYIGEECFREHLAMFSAHNAFCSRSSGELFINLKDLGWFSHMTENYSTCENTVRRLSRSGAICMNNPYTQKYTFISKDYVFENLTESACFKEIIEYSSNF